MRVRSNTPPDPLRVLRRMWQAKDCIDAGVSPVDESGNPIRLLEIYMGGGMSGVFGGGVACGFQAAGLNTVAKKKIGISSGVATAIASGLEYSPAVPPFYAGLLEKPFINLRRGRGYVMRLREDVIDPISRIWGAEAIHRSPVDLYAVVTESPSGKGKLLDLKSDEYRFNWIDIMQASMALPGMTHEVDLGGICHVDGGCSWPIPLVQAIRLFKPTDILVIASRPLPHEVPFVESWYYWWYLETGLFWTNPPPAIKRGTRMIDARTLRSLKFMRRIKCINCLALFPRPESTIPSFPLPLYRLNAEMVLKAGHNGKSLIEGLLEDARKPFVLAE